MATTSNIRVTTQLHGDHWVITAEVLPGSFLPPEIFIYENTGTDELGDYFGVCGKDELLRLQVWQGEPIAKFGNRFVRYGQAKIIIDASTSPPTAPKAVTDNLIATAKQLSLALQTASSTTQIVTV